MVIKSNLKLLLVILSLNFVSSTVLGQVLVKPSKIYKCPITLNLALGSNTDFPVFRMQSTLNGSQSYSASFNRSEQGPNYRVEMVIDGYNSGPDEFGRYHEVGSVSCRFWVSTTNPNDNSIMFSYRKDLLPSDFRTCKQLNQLQVGCWP